MRTIKIYNTRQARKDLKAKKVTPMKASILKWVSLWEAMYTIREEMTNDCGLCLTHSLCEGCPLGDCCEMDTFREAIRAMNEALISVDAFQKELEVISFKES